MVLSLEEGKFYRTRVGRKVGPMRLVEGVLFEAPSMLRGWQWHGDGRRVYPSPDDDLVAEWADAPSPVRTVTRKEIVDGTYGELTVSSYDATRARIHLVRNILNADEVRAAASTLIEIADALESETPV